MDNQYSLSCIVVNRWIVIHCMSLSTTYPFVSISLPVSLPPFLPSPYLYLPSSLSFSPSVFQRVTATQWARWGTTASRCQACAPARLEWRAWNAMCAPTAVRWAGAAATQVQGAPADWRAPPVNSPRHRQSIATPRLSSRPCNSSHPGSGLAEAKSWTQWIFLEATCFISIKKYQKVKRLQYNNNQIKLY